MQIDMIIDHTHSVLITNNIKFLMVIHLLQTVIVIHLMQIMMVIWSQLFYCHQSYKTGMVLHTDDIAFNQKYEITYSHDIRKYQRNVILQYP